MAKVYSISFNWAHTNINADHIDKIDNILNGFGDWLRFSGYSWYIYTDSSAFDLQQGLLHLLHSEDAAMIAPVDIADLGGWAKPWVWEWMRKSR